jgi:hypothetical protein
LIGSIISTSTIFVLEQESTNSATITLEVDDDVDDDNDDGYIQVCILLFVCLFASFDLVVVVGDDDDFICHSEFSLMTTKECCSLCFFYSTGCR